MGPRDCSKVEPDILRVLNLRRFESDRLLLRELLFHLDLEDRARHTRNIIAGENLSIFGGIVIRWNVYCVVQDGDPVLTSDIRCIGVAFSLIVMPALKERYVRYPSSQEGLVTMRGLHSEGPVPGEGFLSVGILEKLVRVVCVFQIEDSTGLESCKIARLAVVDNVLRDIGKI